MNQLQFIGNVGREPEMRYTPSGQAVTNFSVGVNEKYTTSAGEKVSKTIWCRVTTWGKLAENCKQYVRKGMKVYVSGKLNAADDGNPRTYQDKSGNTKASFEMTARDVEFLSHVDDEPQATSGEIPEEDMPF